MPIPTFVERRPPGPLVWNTRYVGLRPLLSNEIIFKDVNVGPWRDTKTQEPGSLVNGPAVYALSPYGYTLDGVDITSGSNYQTFPWAHSQTEAWMNECIVRIPDDWPLNETDKQQPIASISDGTSADRALATNRTAFGQNPRFRVIVRNGAVFSAIFSDFVTGGKWYHVIWGTGGVTGAAQNNRRLELWVNGRREGFRSNNDGHGTVYSSPEVHINHGWLGDDGATADHFGRHQVLLFRTWVSDGKEPGFGHLREALFEDPWFMYRGNNAFPVVVPSGDINLVTDTLNFGTVFIPNEPILPVTIQNVGPVDLTISSITLRVGSDAEFSFAADTPPIIVPASGNTVIQVKYSPTTVGSHSGFIDIDSDDPDEPTVSVTLSGSSLVPSAGPFIGTHDPDEIAIGTFADDAPVGIRTP